MDSEKIATHDSPPLLQAVQAYGMLNAAERILKEAAYVSEAIGKGNINAINYFLGQKYLDALKSIGTADNSKMVMLPLEATNILGSIAGIGEIAKESLAKQTTKRD